VQKIIIDCDPGIDDAVAIFLALASRDDIEVLGVTCVNGNVGLDKTHMNARRIVAAAQRLDIPVLRGIPRPILAPASLASSSHGLDGLGDIAWPIQNPQADDKADAVSFIRQQADRFPGEVTLCAIGPLTNVAVALLFDPSLAEKLRSIVFMGGAAYCAGNMNAYAEFNFLLDPHAAEIVLQSGARLIMFGLDVTLKAVIKDAHLAELRRNRSICSEIAARLLEVYSEGDRHLHDPCVIAWLIDPTLFSGVQSRVKVVTEQGPQFGRSLAAAQPNGNCLVINEVDEPRLFKLLLSRLALLP